MTKAELKECRIIMDRVADNMGIIAAHLREDTGRKLARLSRALQIYQQRQQLARLKEDIGGLMYQGFSKN